MGEEEVKEEVKAAQEGTKTATEDTGAESTDVSSE